MFYYQQESFHHLKYLKLNYLITLEVVFTIFIIHIFSNILVLIISSFFFNPFIIIKLVLYYFQSSPPKYLFIKSQEKNLLIIITFNLLLFSILSKISYPLLSSLSSKINFNNNNNQLKHYLEFYKLVFNHFPLIKLSFLYIPVYHSLILSIYSIYLTNL